MYPAYLNTTQTTLKLDNETNERIFHLAKFAVSDKLRGLAASQLKAREVAAGKPLAS